MRIRSKKTYVTGGSLKGKAARKHCGMSGKALHPDHDDFFTALGRRARDLRKAKGWTLQDMVVLHGYHVSQWQKIERGCAVTVDSLLRMAGVFGLTLGQLLGELVEMPRPTETPQAAAKGLASKQARTVTKVTTKSAKRTAAK